MYFLHFFLLIFVCWLPFFLSLSFSISLFIHFPFFSFTRVYHNGDGCGSDDGWWEEISPPIHNCHVRGIMLLGYTHTRTRAHTPSNTLRISPVPSIANIIHNLSYHARECAMLERGGGTEGSYLCVCTCYETERVRCSLLVDISQMHSCLCVFILLLPTTPSFPHHHLNSPAWWWSHCIMTTTTTTVTHIKVE